MKALKPYEILADTRPTTRRRIPEGLELPQNRNKNVVFVTPRWLLTVLGAFAKLQKATTSINFVMSVRMEKIRNPVDGFS
jgi:hypothetical protein